MICITVHCGDEIDRVLLIPLSQVEEVHTNADGSDWIKANGKIYTPRNQDNFYLSLVDISKVVDAISESC